MMTVGKCNMSLQALVAAPLGGLTRSVTHTRLVRTLIPDTAEAHIHTHTHMHIHNACRLAHLSEPQSLLFIPPHHLPSGGWPFSIPA